jgi:hypothetical protein
MSATNAPFGLRPAYFPTGLERAQALANGIASGYSSNILKGQPVIYNASAGTIVVATAPAAGASAASYPVTGSFQGVEWTDSTGRRRVSNYWPASTTAITGSVIAYFYNDLNIVYEIQADGSMAQTTIGNEYNFSNITAGSTTTGLSQATLSATGVGNGVQGQMRVVDIAQYPDNAWGDAYTIVRVQLAITQFYGAYTAIA